VTLPVAARILITGFGRFPGSPFNPSGEIARRLGAGHDGHWSRWSVSGARIVTHVFATTYDAVDRELPALLARERPDAVVLIGVATRARAIRLELLARNRVSVLAADAAGKHADRLAIAPRRASAMHGRFPVAPLLAALRSTRLPVTVSRDAGRYLCNYAYWRALEATHHPGGPRVVVFVHVPPAGAWIRGHGPGPRAKVLAGQTRALGTLLRAVVTSLGRSRAT
jgi:pyroglutamyl-peptidase